jgi:hypothetical protein
MMRSFSIHALSVLFILAKIPKGSTMKRGLKLSMRNCMFRISILAVFFVGCSAHERKPETDSLDAKGLIRRPAQLGAKGISQIVSSLQARYGVAAGTPLSPLVNTKQAITLDDGTVLIQTLTDLNATGDVTRDVRMDVAAQPCLPSARAAAWIGAQRLSAIAGSDIVSGHVDYRFENAQVRIDLTGEFGGRECLRVIEIYKQPQA